MAERSAAAADAEHAAEQAAGYTAGHAPRRILILGAAGRDFHDFNVVFRDDPAVHVVGFTAAQIPGIARRTYPPELSGPRYPAGLPIWPEEELEAVCARERVEAVVFSYSDVTYDHVGALASRALAAGCDVALLAPRRTMLRSRLPVVAVTAVRTGAGKSQVSRWVAGRLAARGLRVAVLRHPMPYGDLARQRAQRFAEAADLAAADCTIEEREEYEPHLAAGHVVFAGVDYAEILRMAEGEADVVVWDGGNNDTPFLRPDLHVVLADALRPGQIGRYHPGETTLRMADVVVVNKVDAATPEQLAQVEAEVRARAPGVPLVRAASPVALDDPEAVRGRRVLVVEDGPTITHGEMPHGAGYAAAIAAGGDVVDPRPHLARLAADGAGAGDGAGGAAALAAAYAAYPHIGPVLPALGYGAAQLAALRAAVAAVPADVVVAGTPVDLGALLASDAAAGGIPPVVRARYAFREAARPGEPTLGAAVDAFLDRLEGGGTEDAGRPSGEAANG